MSKERWQPPPLNNAPREDSPKAKLTVDEQVVRKMLKVNPTLRAGRTTSQVKKALERGEPLVRDDSAEPKAAAAPATKTPQATQLKDTVEFFLSGKADALAKVVVDIETRKKALDDELASAKAKIREQLLSFIGLLDAEAVETHGAAVLAEHAPLLRQLDLDPRSILDATRRKSR